jgi:ABC-type transporter Mla MlaB component
LVTDFPATNDPESPLMAKEDTAPGLLSKVVKFVRNPATNWSDLDAKESGREEALSKQLLKEMIERKRRNDFVRKREFDMLRKMRKREAMTGQDPGARPSFFQSSLPSKPDDRAVTLKKIDEIEAQMSMQWWKTKHGSSTMNSVSASSIPPSQMPAGAGSLSTHAPLLENALPASYVATAPMSLPATSAKADAPAPVKALMPDMLAFEPARPVTPTAAGISALSREGSPSGFSASKFSVHEAVDVAHDPELEEASIHFANGDDAGAEAGLLETLGPQGARVQHAETWLTLFDLYRATGQQEKFESQAIEFVGRFDRSAPQWFSMPDMVKQLSRPAALTSAGGPVADWVCPSSLGIQSIAALNAALARSPMPWRLDWSKLKAIEVSAVEPLCNVFSGWAAQPVQLRFIGEPQLQRVLHEATPSGVRDTLQSWWQLRLEVLRVMNRPDEFELTALDFCVTYEVSPPAWASARCEYKALDPRGPASEQAIISEVYRDSIPSSMSIPMEGDTEMGGNSQMSQLFAVELSGQIQGDAIEVLDRLEAKLMGADIMIISCEKLIRVDFSAAGTMLNWVCAREAENRAVLFTEVNRLVAAFFNVIGITEHARVLPRID